MELPVALFVPNLLGYARIILAVVGLFLSESHPVAAVCTWIFSASLDLIDGILARKLNQCSSLGVLIDIAADNILRTTVWIAIAQQSNVYRIVASIIVSMEWITMVCTQLHASQSGNHWKSQRKNDPWLIRSVFANNFKTPIGALAIYGLFFANLCLYCADYAVFTENIPFFDLWMYTAFCGRALTAIVEVRLVRGYLSLVIERDLESRKKSEKTS